MADELSVQPSHIYLWVKQLLDQADRAFQPHGRRNPGPHEVQQRQANLEAALARKDVLLAELLHQFVRLAQQPQQSLAAQAILRDWHQCDKPSRQDAATFPSTGRLSPFTNAGRQGFRFPLNQDS